MCKECIYTHHHHHHTIHGLCFIFIIIISRERERKRKKRRVPLVKKKKEINKIRWSMEIWSLTGWLKKKSWRVGNLYTGKCCMAGGLKKVLFSFYFYSLKRGGGERFFSVLFETVHTIDLIASDRRRRTMPTPRIIYRFFFISLPGRSFCFVFFFFFLTHKWDRSILNSETAFEREFSF